MIHDGKERRTRWGGRWWKVFGYIQSQCAAFCVAFKVTIMDMERCPSFFFFVRVFRINFPFIVLLKPETWKHCSSRRCAHNPLIQSQTVLGLRSKPISGCSFVVKYKIQNWLFFPESVSFFFSFFFNFKQSLKIKKMLVPEQCVKVKTILSLKWFQELML